MKILILQFSGTGNTYFIADKIKKILIEKGHDVDCFPIEKIKSINELILQYNLLGVGFPVYGSDMPDILRNMVEAIIKVKDMRAFTFCTQMMYSGDGAAYLAKKLIEKGFSVRQCTHFNMPNNLRDYAKFLPTKVNYSRIDRRTNKQVKRFCNNIIQNKKRLKGMNIFSHFLGLLQRYPYQKMIRKIQVKIHIEETCILCKKCIDLCPVGNFIVEEGKLKELGKCIICYRCINHCPKNSLHINKRQIVDKPYLGPTENFNISNVYK